MRASCPNCPKTYDIPEERLPMGKVVSFPCPNCKGVIRLDLRLQASGENQGPDEQNQGLDTVASEPAPDGTKLRKKILRSFGDLPPMLQVITKAREVMNNPRTSFKEIADILEKDQAMAGRILKMANSAYYGLSGQVSSIQHAAVVLGHQTLEDLITVAGTSSFMAKTLKGYRMASGDMWRHSLIVAFGARTLCKTQDPKLENDGFSAGLFHDMGKIVLDPFISGRQQQYEALLKQSQGIEFKAEKSLLGLDHAEIGSELCDNWKIPEVQSQAIRHHHQPSQSDANKLAFILHVTDVVAKAKQNSIKDWDGLMAENALEHLGLAPEQLEQLVDEAIEQVDAIAGEIIG